MVRRNVKRFSRKKRSYRWKSTKKRTYTRKKRRLGNNNGLPGLPNGKTVKMRYQHLVRPITSAGTHGLQVYRMNAIFDCDYTGITGTQPLSHDQYDQFYKEYLVVGAKATTTFRWKDVTPSVDFNVACFAFMDSDTTAPTTLTTKRERYPGKVKILKPDPTSVCSITTHFSAKQWFKLKDVMDDEKIRGLSFNVDPIEQAYLVTGVQDYTQTEVVSNVIIDTVITYIVKLLDPKPILGS